jgi:catechol 2,3-dioxygenase-like lactoylglutathione lyase family enzyme
VDRAPAYWEGDLREWEEGVIARRLAYLSIYVSSLRDSRGFYGDLLGLPIVTDEAWGVVLDAGGVQLFLHPRSGDEPHQRVEMTFDVDDVDSAIADLKARGVPEVEEASDREWGDRDGAVLDPDGNVIYMRSMRRSQPFKERSRTLAHQSKPFPAPVRLAWLTWDEPMELD